MASNNESVHSRDGTPWALRTLPEVLSCLSSLQSKEGELSAELAHKLSDRASVVHSVSCLQSLLPRLDDLSAEAHNFFLTASATAKTAEHVGGHVRSLDEEMRRVREAAERVGQVMELKSALVALRAAMEQKDWESATRHCARAMSLPIGVIAGPFAETAVPTQESHLPPAQTLEATRQQLLVIFRQEFEIASQSRDAAATSRFFKLFPAIGWETEGLQAYATFVVDLVRVRAPASAKTSSPLYYITALTALFENIAVIVDQHQPIVEKYYGLGKMAYVLDRLLREADRVVHDLVEGWEEERAIKRKVHAISAHQGSNAIAASAWKQAGQSLDDNGDLLDPRDIDRVLTEMVGMSGRWSRFRRFMYDRFKDGLLEEQSVHRNDDYAEPNGSESSVPHNPMNQQSNPATLQTIENCASHQRFQEILTSYYVPLEVWYTRAIIDKAHRTSNTDPFQSPLLTTTPDDVFYILKIVLSRVLCCGSSMTVQRTSEQLRDVVDSDYTGVIKKKLDDVYRTGPVAGTKGEKAERDSRRAFVTLLNDLDISSLYMERLVQEVAASPMIDQYFLDSESEAVRNNILSFNNIAARFRSTLRTGIEQLFNQLIRPKLRTFIQDIYKDMSYVLDEDAYSTANQHGTMRKRFVRAWEALVDDYKDIFTENNYRLFFGLALDVLVRPWERLVVTFKYNELGAIRFDQDLRSIVSYLSSQTAFGDVREKFVRLQQISILINLDTEEDVDEFYNGSGISWQLDDQEARTIASLRI